MRRPCPQDKGHSSSGGRNSSYERPRKSHGLLVRFGRNDRHRLGDRPDAGPDNHRRLFASLPRRAPTFRRSRPRRHTPRDTPPGMWDQGVGHHQLPLLGAIFLRPFSLLQRARAAFRAISRWRSRVSVLARAIPP